MGFESEMIERAALADLHAAATPELVQDLRLQVLSVGSTLVSIAAALPRSALVINRAIGIGLSTAETEETVRDLMAACRSAGVDRYLVQRHPEAKPAELVEWLYSAGLKKARGWQKFRRGRDTVPDVQTELRVEEIGPEYGTAFGQIVCDAFNLGDLAVPWLARLPGRSGWHVFMSFRGDEPAGVAALFVKDGLAWCDYGATAPDFRRLGSHGAILARRLQFALDLGCREIFSCTGEDVPWDPQHSFKNQKRIAFQEDYIRENYLPSMS